MPTPPSRYTSGPLSAQQLNSDMYSANATITGATGILYHTLRPLLSETVLQGGTAYTSLSQQPIQGAGLQAFSVIDNSAYYSFGADFPGVYPSFRFRNYVGTSGGSVGSYSGRWLTWGFPYLGPVTNSPGGVGAQMFINGTFTANGVFQWGSTLHNNCPWYLDLVAPGFGSTTAWQPGFWWLSASTPALQGSTQDTSGQVTRMGWLWQGVSAGSGTGTVTTIPAPTASWGTVTSANLNNTIGSCLTLLNNPPMLHVSTASTQSISNTVIQALNLNTAAGIDNYNGWFSSSTASNYTVPLPGLYLFSPTIGWGTTSSSGIRLSSVNVIPGGTGAAQIFQGPTYRATPVGPGTSGVGMTGTSVVRIFNLRAGDVVVPSGEQTSGGNLALLGSYGTRFIGTFMSPVAASGTTLTYSAPNPSFRWQAGALAGTALTAALNLRLGNDMSFLVNRPYFTGYQTSAQSFGTASAFNKVTMNVVGALPYGGNGDNYGGWNSSTHVYESQVAGWYLCIADLYVTPPVSGTLGVVTAGLSVSTSGGILPFATPDWYQQVYYPIVSAFPPGATAIGLYYLEPGETIYPAVQTQNWGGTWGTYVLSGSVQVYSQFSCFWVSS